MNRIMNKIMLLIVILTLVIFSLLTWEEPIPPANPATSTGELHAVTVLPSGKVLIGQ